MMVSIAIVDFAGGAIADDQLALAATDRNHRVDRHDAGLHRLTDAAALDDAGRDFFHRIKCFRFDSALAIERLAEGVDDATEQRLARPGPESKSPVVLTSSPSDILVGSPSKIAPTSVSSRLSASPKTPLGKFDHLVQHHVAQSFDARDAVAGFADDPDVALGGRGFQSRDFGFDFFKNAAHISLGNLKLLLKSLQTIAHAAVPDVAPDANAHPAEQCRVNGKLGR